MAEKAGERATGQQSKEPAVITSTGETKISELGDKATSSGFSSGAETDSNIVDGRFSSLFHIPAEIEEFHRLCEEIVTTPRKMKRILNM